MPITCPITHLHVYPQVSTAKLLMKSQIVQSFFLEHFIPELPAISMKIMGYLMNGQMEFLTTGTQYQGLEQVSDAADCLMVSYRGIFVIHVLIHGV